MITKLAKLARLKISKSQKKYFKKQFEETLKIIDQFKDLETKDVKETYTVTGTKNVLREDKININNVLTQEEALSNARKTHNGYFVVDGILNND